MDRKGGCVSNTLKPNPWLYYVRGVCVCWFTVPEITAPGFFLSVFRDGTPYSGYGGDSEGCCMQGPHG